MTAAKSAEWMKTWVLHEIADTAGMTQAEVGAYWLLKMAMWRAAGRLPAKDAKLAVIARCELDEWLAIKERVLAPFHRRGGALTQPRMDDAITDYHEAFVSRSKGGKATAAKKRSENNENAGRSVGGEHLPSAANKKKKEKDREDDDQRSSSLSSPARQKKRQTGADSDPSVLAARLRSVLPESIPERVRGLVVAERDEAFAVKYVDPSAWRDGSIRAHNGYALTQLSGLRCLAEEGISILIGRGEKAA